MYSKIVNPKTGRKVNVGGKIGRTILRNYLIVLSEGGAQARAWVAPWHATTPLRRKVALVLAGNPKLGKYKRKVYDLLVANGGRLPKPGTAYGTQWQYDTLREKLVARGIDTKDAEEIIRLLWTFMLPTLAYGLHPALLKQLRLANVEVPPLPIA
uniref:Uncharacterized protein n=1 Tax=viral metagenome TaxID=1070528 RepID=A0A6C0B3W4_9ZZZZ